MKLFAISSKKNIITILILLISIVANAHGTVSSSSGFVSGILHPLFGFDHLLAMLAVGMISVKIGGKAIWYVPLLFIIVMFLGSNIGIYYPDVVDAEIGISLSILVLGLSLFVTKKIPLFVIYLGVALFALLHGHAHGVEMPSAGDPFYYALGFMSGSAIIHLLGIGLMELIQKSSKSILLTKIVATIISVCGLYYLMQLFL